MNIKSKVIAFLKQGLTPHELALCIAFGCMISIVPMLGTTTLLCALVAWAMNLNQVAMQSVNWLMYPLQFLLLIPWYKLGARLFSASPVHLTPDDVRFLIHASFWQAIQLLWTVTWHAVIAWMIFFPFVTGILYFTLKPLFKNVAQTIRL